MPAIHVCSLASLEATVASLGASHVATLISAQTAVPRPATVAPEDHLFLAFNDIVEPTDGLTPPSVEHVEAIVAFARRWDQARPMVIHCFAGISRSTAGAFIATCALDPDRDEAVLAADIRHMSPTATPNIRMVRFADELLGRNGRMVAAIEAIGRGRDAFEGIPFSLGIRRPQAR